MAVAIFRISFLSKSLPIMSKAAMMPMTMQAADEPRPLDIGMSASRSKVTGFGFSL